MDQMSDADLYGLVFFSGGALWHTPYQKLRDLVEPLQSEQTFKELTARHKGWFSRARKEYNGMIYRRLYDSGVC